MFNFYHSSPISCPYIDGLFEQQLFFKLSKNNGIEEYNKLSQAGFRRSHDIAYRPSCYNCNACQTIRVKVNDFKINKNWQRILNKNNNISMEIIDGKNYQPIDSDEQFNLFFKYVTTRHNEGGMAEMTDMGGGMGSLMDSENVISKKEADKKKRLKKLKKKQQKKNRKKKK